MKKFYVSDEQSNIIELAKKILEKELVPCLGECEKNGTFPMEVFKSLYDAGLYGLDVPEKYGGMGISHETSFKLNEEMAWYDAGFAFSFRLGSLVANLVYMAGTEYLKQYVSELVLSGKIGAFCLTEAEAGSDAAAIRTTAKREGDEYVLNGVKSFISNGAIADFFIIAATIDRNLKHKGITLFLVEKERGVKVGKVEDKMGLKTSLTSEVILEDVRIPADHLIGEEGKGFVYAMKDMDSIRPMSMTYAVGIMQRALDEAVNYAKTRKTFGKPIIANQGLAFILADMQKLIHVSRSSLLYIAKELDEGHPLNGIGSSAKIFVSDCAMKVTVDAVQVFGGYGYMKEYPVEKLMRDAKIFSIFEGTNQIQQTILTSMLSQ
ncbi:Acyl-CoA dehydrogenase [bioreactor metagenome]|uniref:Acyl-CoA dehydrogenase n=1 Tax=bioreactor metagenome TaxID=1076179 RepID=A0A644WVS9_9ZZZZ